jgi:redox-sensitive bicupin YhaK (pirin superfamily)
MSKRSEPVAAETCVALGASAPALEAHPARELMLGQLKVARALPVKERRLVGPWCFLDRFGPASFSDGKPMDVAPHPHIGLQTVTWLLEGEIVHDDSLNNESVLRPGGVNVMTAGFGIAHAEQTPRDNSGRLNGVQLWTALPDADRNGDSGFAHVPEVPVLELAGGVVQIFAGAVGSVASPAPYFSELIGADLRVHSGHDLNVPLEPRFEHAVLLLDGDCAVDRQPLAPQVLYYLGAGRPELCASSRGGCRLLLLGGPPFPERVLMWWNFVARTPEEIAQARHDWQDERRFGAVTAYKGPRLAAPTLATLARPNPVS